MSKLELRLESNNVHFMEVSSKAVQEWFNASGQDGEEFDEALIGACGRAKNDVATNEESVSFVVIKVTR